MQGRLSPVVDGKLQAFPTDTWRDEFSLAAACGFDLIEWVFDEPNWTANPLLHASGRAAIRELQRQHGVSVPLVCADYFMARPLTSADPAVRAEAVGALVELIRVAPSIGIRLVELPCIGNAALDTDDAASAAVALFDHLAPLLESADVCLLLELSLGPAEVADLFQRIRSPRVRLNYDTGNSAYWGFDPAAEFASYGPLIRNVHIKDVTRADYTVPLGRGDVDFDLSFSLLKRVGYSGDFVLQAARGDDHAAVARQFAAFTRQYVDRYLA